MIREDWLEVAGLIHSSTNAWYESHGMGKIFNCTPEETQLFCQVYEDLDPGCCWLAVCKESQEIAGSCFFHPRQTHVSLGIMNVHPHYFGNGIARQLLKRIIDFSEERNLPLKLVSSALNLDSFSLYSKSGFVPQTIYQDLIVKVPEEGLRIDVSGSENVRPAQLSDVDKIVDLEFRLTGLKRYKDYKYFIDNSLSIWTTFVYEREGEIHGVLSSVRHPASHMIGPGVAENHEVMMPLIARCIEKFKNTSVVFLLPANEHDAIQQAYKWGAKNCEIHFAQIRGEMSLAQGIFMPTFMPETS